MSLKALRAHLLSQLPAHPIIGAVLTALMTGFDDASSRNLGTAFAVNTTISICIGATLAVLYAAVIDRFAARRAWWLWLLHAGSLAIAVVVGTELALAALGLVFTVNNSLELRYGIWQVATVVATLMTVFGVTSERRHARQREIERRADQAQQELLEARLDNLRARLNPHFLFNSLNTVAALIEEDRQRAVAAVERLGELLRYGLEGTREPAVPLRREAEAVRDYLTIEQLRFGERLRYAVDLDPAIAEAKVPPLCLQPLVENAVKHGVAAKAGGCVHVTATGHDQHIELVVTDDGPGTSSAGGTQTGEANLRQRLRLTYGDAASLRAGPRVEGGYQAVVTLPRDRS